MRKRIKKAGPVIGVAVLVALWGSYAAVGKILLEDLDTYQLLFYTFLFASIVLTAITGITGLKEQRSMLTAKQMPTLIFPGVLCFGYYFFYNNSLSTIPAVQASILNYTFPVWMIIISAIVNRKMPKLKTLAAVLLGFAGVMLVLTNGGATAINFDVNLVGAALALASAILWGGFSIAGSKIHASPLAASTFYTVESLVLSTVALFSFSKFVLPGWEALAGLLWIGAMTVAIPYWLWFGLIKKLGVDKMAAFSYLTPFATLLFIALFLHEGIGFGHILGLVVIIAGCLIGSSAFNPSLKRGRMKEEKSNP